MKNTISFTVFLYLLIPVWQLYGQSIFFSPDSITCDGKVQVSYTGGGTYDSLVWDWGNGLRTAGIQSSGTYTVPGTYTLILYRYTGTAYDSVLKSNYIQYTPAGMPLPACVQGQGNYCCGYGITGFGLSGFMHGSTDGAEGFRDFSCLDIPALQEGSTVSLLIQSGTSLPQDYRVWIDLNHNGSLEHPAELLYAADNVQDVSAQVNIPAATVYNTPLLMLVSADFAGSQPLPCSTPQFGQTELYRVPVVPAPGKPVAGFFSPEENQVSCNGFVSFSNTSQNNPTHYSWDFGDGTGSTLPNPGHQYQQSGTFTVSLVAGNSAGTDTLVRNAYIHVALSAVCDSIYMPVSGSRVETYYCNGVIMDDGRKNNYSDHTNGTLTIAPSFAKTITLNFTEFDFETGFDFLYIYDGPNATYPLIGKFSGHNLPLGGHIQSTGPALTLIQQSDDVYNLAGFTAHMLCELGQAENVTPPSVYTYPNPCQDILNLQTEQPIDKIEIISMQGSVIMSRRNPPASLHLDAFPPGIYQVCIYTGGTLIRQKMIRN